MVWRERTDIMIPCACGCRTEIAEADSRGRPRRFARGHGNKGGSNTWLVKEEVNSFTARERARKALARAGRPRLCEVAAIGACKGTVEVHHRDGDPWNNDPANLIALCRAHHRLTHNGKIDLDAPAMPAFYVDGSGKRRYA